MGKNRIEFSDMDLRKLDLTRKYDDDFSEDEGISWRDHILLYTIGAVLVIFIVWANLATLDEVARGDGKVIPSSEVQVIQNLEGGIIEEYPVAEGDTVEQGQVILRMRNVQARSDFESTNQKYYGLLASTARLQAEAEGKAPVFAEELYASAADAVATETAAYEANRREQESQAAILKEQLRQKEHEVQELKRRISDISQVLSLAREEYDMVAPMVDKGAASKKELLQLDRQIAQQKTELNGLKLALPRSEAAVNEARQRIDEHDRGFKANAQRELAAKMTELNAIGKTLAAYQDKSARTEIKSPVKGTVKDIKVKTVGGVVRPGDPIMEIVPLEDRLIVESRIRPADIAFIHAGQKATVRLTAFDFSIYGALDGEVSDISADTITNEKGESFYRVRITTAASSVEKNGKTLEIMPGMQATVDILTGEKTVMNYLLKPFVKASRTALRER